MKGTNSVADAILAEAAAYARTHANVTWRDYSRFKNQLISHGCYGYEATLANILGL